MAMMHDGERKRVPLFSAMQVLAHDHLGDLVARLSERGVLYVDPAAPREDQLWAIEQAARYLRTGEHASAQPIRHLRVVR